MKSLPFIIILILFFYSPMTGQVPDSIKFKSLLPYDFHLAYLKADTAILVDVREFFEFRRTRLREAVNIPSSGDLEVVADSIDKQIELFLYCTNDYRSKRVAKYFYDCGFRKVYSLDGGIILWKKDGFPVVKKRLKTKDTRHR